MNDDDDDDNDTDGLLFQQEEEEERAAAIEASAAQRVQQQRRRRERSKRKLNSILDRQNEFPERQRSKIDELIELFLVRLEDDIHEMVTEVRHPNGYRGLDSSRDTEAEVETALREFPRVLSRRGRICHDYPITCLTYTFDDNDNTVRNVHAVSFVHVFVLLAIEFGSFEDDQSGGLLIEDQNECNSLRFLASNSYRSYRFDDNHQRLVDETFLVELMRLRRIELMKKEYISQFNLVNDVFRECYFAQRRFQFFTEWNPSSLLQIDDDGNLALHFTTWVYNETLEPFRSVFTSCIHYFPIKVGVSLLFRKDNEGETPFQLACEKFRRKAVMNVVEGVLSTVYSDNDATNTTASSMNVPSAIMLAATDNNVHLDGVHFLVRRHPDVLINLLRPRLNSNDNDGDNSKMTSTGNRKRKRDQF